MTAETMLLGLGLVGALVALGARASRLSAWWLFGAGCVPAALVVVLAVAATSTPCDQPQPRHGLGVLFVLAFGTSLVLYAGALVAGLLEGARSGKAGGYGRLLSSVVVCPLASIVGGGVVLYAALAAMFHCFEF